MTDEELAKLSDEEVVQLLTPRFWTVTTVLSVASMPVTVAYFAALLGPERLKVFYVACGVQMFLGLLTALHGGLSALAARRVDVPAGAAVGRVMFAISTVLAVPVFGIPALFVLVLVNSPRGPA